MPSVTCALGREQEREQTASKEATAAGWMGEITTLAPKSTGDGKMATFGIGFQDRGIYGKLAWRECERAEETESPPHKQEC